MSVNNSQNCLPAPELIAAMTGSNVTIGTLLFVPVIMILDNQSTSAVVLTINGVQWKTFAGGEALVLDLRGNHGIAENFTFSIGTTFSGNGAANGNFSISYVYAQSN